METLPKFGVSRADMMKRVARFKDLKGSDGGLPDSKAPHCERTLYNVIGFQPPDDEGGAVTSQCPVSGAARGRMKKARSSRSISIRSTLFRFRQERSGASRMFNRPRLEKTRSSCSSSAAMPQR